MNELRRFLDSCVISILRAPDDFGVIAGYSDAMKRDATIIYIPKGKTFEDYLAWQAARDADRELRRVAWRATHPEVTP